MRSRKWLELPSICACDDRDCELFSYGYPLCRWCDEHHRWWPGCPGPVGYECKTVPRYKILAAT